MDFNGRAVSFEIDGFKHFRNLVLPRVGQVNLIAGKNNVGKSSLLEAIRIFASGCDPLALFKTLAVREQATGEVELYKSLRTALPTPITQIRFGDSKLLLIHSREWAQGFNVSKDYRNPPIGDFGRWLILQKDSTSFAFDVSSATRQTAYLGLYGSDAEESHVVLPCQESMGLDRDAQRVKSLWDKIQGLSGEEALVDLLRILDPRITRIVLPTTGAIATPQVRLNGKNELEPLTRFGDGLTALFNIGVALVNASGGFLLADEIENGLHYSMFPKLWEFLLESCARLNVVMFATTHSSDAAESFSNVAISNTKVEGLLTRLVERNGNVEAIQFSEREAYIAALEGLEVR